MTQNGRKVFKLNQSIPRKMLLLLDKLEGLNPEVHCTHRSKSAFTMHNVVKPFLLKFSYFYDAAL